jgi:hypothetical protein
VFGSNYFAGSYFAEGAAVLDDTRLDATALCVVTATADLTVGMSGTVTCAVTTAAALSTGITMTAAVSGVVVTSTTLTTQITLTGAVSGVVTISAPLSTTIALSTQVLGTCQTASALLNTRITCASSVLCEADALGQLIIGTHILSASTTDKKSRLVAGVVPVNRYGGSVAVLEE